MRSKANYLLPPRQVPPDGTFFEGNNTYVTGCGTVLHGTHDEVLCAGRHCVVHNPSDHSMRGFKTHWRSDKGQMERICPHGIGHPDPDDLLYQFEQGRRYLSIHGCDGCCHEPTPAHKRKHRL